MNSIGDLRAMASGDIRKWFMKQPAKSTPAATSVSFTRQVLLSSSFVLITKTVG